MSCNYFLFIFTGLIRPRLSVLPASFSYTGGCSSQSTADAIKDQLFVKLEEYASSSVVPNCLPGSSCKCKNLAVNCDSSFQTDSVSVNLVLTISGNVSNWYDVFKYFSALIEMSNNLQNAVFAGEFDLSDRTVIQDSYQRAQISEIKCEGSGQVRKDFKCSKKWSNIFLLLFKIYQCKFTV